VHLVAYGLDTALLVACIVWTALLLSAAGRRRRRVRTRGEYVRDPDVFGLPPAFVAYFWRGGETRGVDAAATLLDLIDRGVVTLESPRDPTEGGAAGYRLRRQKAAGTDVLPHEQVVLSLVFDLGGQRTDTVSSDELHRLFRLHRHNFLAGMAAFFRIVDDQAQEAAGALSYSGLRQRRRCIVPALAGMAGSALLWVALSSPACVTGIVAGALLGTVAFALSVNVPKATLVQDRAEGLCCYIKDFGDFRRRPPEMVVLWEKYLVYAVAFGLDAVAAEALWAPHMFALMEEEILGAYEWWASADLTSQDTPAPIRRIAAEVLPTPLPLIGPEADRPLKIPRLDLGPSDDRPLKVPRL
jgi:Predicted membrane protein (DUF2207)